MFYSQNLEQNVSDIDQFGIEIEFSASIPDVTIAEITGIPLSRDCNEGWNIGADQTASDDVGDGFELRTPPFTVFPDDLAHKLKLIKKVGWINRTCGLHIHFSGPSFNYLYFLDKMDFLALSKNLYELGAPNPEREHFCQPHDCTHNHKNVVLRNIVDDHWECRVFNSSFDINLIKKYFDLMTGVLYDKHR